MHRPLFAYCCLYVILPILAQMDLTVIRALGVAFATINEYRSNVHKPKPYRFTAFSLYTSLLNILISLSRSSLDGNPA